MGTAPSPDDLRRLYQSWSTDKLLAVIHPAGGYRPEAVRVAEEVLRQREVTLGSPEVQAVTSELDEIHATEAAAAEVPLAKWVQVVCFIFCGVPGITVAAYHMNKKHRRRADDAWSAVGYGWLFRVGLSFLSLLAV